MTAPLGWVVRLAAEVAHSEAVLRHRAGLYGADADAAIARAKERAMTTPVGIVRALDDERAAMADAWMRSQR